MATRSIIAKENDNGTYTGIYCHNDGYPEHNGRILASYYSDENKVDELLALGDISSLGSEIGEQHSFNDYTHPEWTKAYKRDRGEVDTDAVHYANLDEVFTSERGQEYIYIWRMVDGLGIWDCYGQEGNAVALNASDQKDE